MSSRLSWLLALTVGAVALHADGRPAAPAKKHHKRAALAAAPAATAANGGSVVFRGFGANSLGSVAKVWRADQNMALNRPFTSLPLAANAELALPAGDWHVVISDGGGHLQADLKLKLAAGKKMRIKAPVHNAPATAEEEPETPDVDGGEEGHQSQGDTGDESEPPDEEP